MRLRSAATAPAWRRPLIPCDVEFQRLTDFVGLKESPAMANGKTVASPAVNGTRQIWIRMLAGGTPLQVTRRCRRPRAAPLVEALFASSALLYYTRARAQYDEGTIWEIAALGGAPRRVTTSLGGADISHDGQCIAAFAVNRRQRHRTRDRGAQRLGEECAGAPQSRLSLSAAALVA